MRREPPDILITTPESLYLMISSGAREILGGIEAVIVDEIHAVAPVQAGLASGADAGAAGSRWGRRTRSSGSASQRRSGRSSASASSWSEPAASARSSTPASRSSSTSRSSCPSRTWSSPVRSSNKRRDGADTGKTPHQDHSPERIDPGPIEASLDPATNTRSIWPAIYPELLRLVREHNSTIVFVNNRRAAERIAKRLNEMHNDELEEELPATEHAGNSKNGDKAPARDRPRPPRLPLPRGARAGRGAAQVRASSPAWSRPPPWSWASTWAPWTW